MAGRAGQYGRRGQQRSRRPKVSKAERDVITKYRLERRREILQRYRADMEEEEPLRAEQLPRQRALAGLPPEPEPEPQPELQPELEPEPESGPQAKQPKRRAPRVEAPKRGPAKEPWARSDRGRAAVKKLKAVVKAKATAGHKLRARQLAYSPVRSRQSVEGKDAQPEKKYRPELSLLRE